MNNNIPKIEEAITLLYQTHIEDDEIANHRGIAIRAMNKMVELLGGEDVVEKIEAVPWSKRMRAQHLFEDGPPRQPLTHPQIHELDWPEGVSFEEILPFVRAIEAAHGIKGEA